MPHVIVKIWPGKSEEQKRELADKIMKSVMETLNVGESTVSVGIEEVPSEKWGKEVFKPDIVDKEETLYIKPGYKPEGF